MGRSPWRPGAASDVAFLPALRQHRRHAVVGALAPAHRPDPCALVAMRAAVARQAGPVVATGMGVDTGCRGARRASCQTPHRHLERAVRRKRPSGRARRRQEPGRRTLSAQDLGLKRRADADAGLRVWKQLDSETRHGRHAQEAREGSAIEYIATTHGELLSNATYPACLPAPAAKEVRHHVQALRLGFSQALSRKDLTRAWRDRPLRWSAQANLLGAPSGSMASCMP